MNTDILQYRANAQAPWQAIPAIKGEKGDPGPQGPKGADGTMSFSDLTEEQKASLKGETGEQGPKGDSGVWRGSETPPANYDVWLDPSGTNTLSAIASVAIDNNRYIVITFENGSTIRSTNQVPLQDTGIDITIVENLPQTGIAKTIYMVLRTQAFLDDYYDEYMWVNNKWEIIGSTRLDLSDYYTKSQVDSAIASAIAEGGSGLPSDPVVDGSYKLVNTVATVEGTQTATQSWQEDSGGGSSYTFTNGLTESDGTVSSDLYTNFARPYNNSVGIGSFITPDAQTNNSGWYNLVVGKSDGNYKAQPMFQCKSSTGSILFGNVSAFEASNPGIISSEGNNGGNIVGGGLNSHDGKGEIRAQGDGNIVIGKVDSGAALAYGAGNIVVGKNYKHVPYTVGDIRAGDSSVSGYQCQAFGLGVQAYGLQQMVHGRNNVIDRNSKFAEIIGNGSSDTAKSNASALDWSGNQYLAGSLYVGCTDYTTTGSGPTTANCGGQKVFYGTLTNTDTAPTAEGAINWVYK